MNVVSRLMLGIGLLAFSAQPIVAMRPNCPGSSCSTYSVLGDGTFVFTDCWCKGCTTWATADARTAGEWIRNASMDGAMC